MILAFIARRGRFDLFAKEIDSFAVGRPNGIAIFAGEPGQLSVLTAVSIKHPDITSNTGSVVFAECVFKAFVIVKQNPLAIGAHVGCLCRRCQNLHGSSAFNWN